MSDAHQFARDFGITGVLLLAFLLFWRGSEKLGIIGFGKEYQLRRLAEERLAAATERMEKEQGEVKRLIEALPAAVARAVREVMQELSAWMRAAPPSVRAPSPSAPSVPGPVSCDPPRSVMPSRP
jgi:hypothetical protein